MAKKQSTSAEGRRKPVESAAERQLRHALVNVLNDYHQTPMVQMLLGALATVVDWDDSTDRYALEMAWMAIDALVSKQEAERKRVREWYAREHGCAGADSNALAILEIAWLVKWASFAYRLDNPVFVDRGRAAIERCRRVLERRFGQSVPSERDLESWIAAHSARTARARLTTAGIVARIVHRGRLLGARGSDEGRTLRRVTMVLKRHHFTRLVK